MLFAFSLKMLQYLLLLQMLFVSELCGWSMFPEPDQFLKERYLEKLGDKPENNKVERKAFLQLLNHFNDQTDRKYWPQYYYQMKEHYRPGGPALLTIKATTSEFIPDTLIRYAKKFGAVIFVLEHRYYGKGHPVENTSTENLRYLTSEQALADAARFIAMMNDELHNGTKWIAYGGGYSGSLAAWLRLKYPHRVHGAVASSAPFDFKITFPDYYYNQINNAAANNTDCLNSITAAFGELAPLLKNRTGQQKLATLFNLCESKLAPGGEFTYNDKTILNKWLVDVVALTKSIPIPANETENRLCKIMTNQEIGPALNRLAAYINTFGFNCVPYKYDKLKKALQDTEWTSNYGGYRQRLYQTCTEFGLFPTEEYTKSIFGDNDLISFYRQKCYDAFGPKYATFSTLRSGIAHTHVTYGGTNIDVTKVVFVQVTADPWFAAGIQKNISSEAPVIIIEGDHSNSPQLEAAKEKIATYIEAWLKQ